MRVSFITFMNSSSIKILKVLRTTKANQVKMLIKLTASKPITTSREPDDEKLKDK